MFGYMSTNRRPYGNDSYRTIHDKLTGTGRNKPEPFAGNTMRGGWETLRYGSMERAPHEVFVVYSYATVIAIYDPADGTFYENTQHYSVTTSRHQSIARSLTPGHPWAPIGAQYHVECDGERATLDAAANLAPAL